MKGGTFNGGGGDGSDQVEIMKGGTFNSNGGNASVDALNDGTRVRRPYGGRGRKV